MQKNVKTISLIILIIVIIAIIVVLQRPASPPSTTTIETEDTGNTGTKIGDLAPDLAFKDVNDNQVKFSDFRGQGIIVNAWAAWCPFCIDELPDLQQASNENSDLVVLFVHRTKTEGADKTKTYLEEFSAEGTPITDPVLLDPDDSFYSTFFGFGMPVSLFIDKNGIIQDKKTGPMALDEIRTRSEKIV